MLYCHTKIKQLLELLDKSIAYTKTGYKQPYTPTFYLAEVQGHLLDGKVHMERSNLLPQYEQVLDEEEVAVEGVPGLGDGLTRLD